MSERVYLERRARLARGVDPTACFSAFLACEGGVDLPGWRVLWTLRSRAAGAGPHVWRLATCAPGHELGYSAQLPGLGRAELAYSFAADPQGTRVEQSCRFVPSGLAGQLYWHAVRPAHALVFSAMLRGATRVAEARAAA